MLDVEILGAPPRPGPSAAEVRSLCAAAALSAGLAGGHVSVEYVDAARIAELNAAHRGLHEPTDVLSFPIDGAEPLAPARPSRDEANSPPSPPRELGDIVICPEHTADLREAVVHGMLHLLGMDHETDEGEMLALQRRLLDEVPP